MTDRRNVFFSAPEFSKSSTERTISDFKSVEIKICTTMKVLYVSLYAGSIYIYRLPYILKILLTDSPILPLFTQLKDKKTLLGPVLGGEIKTSSKLINQHVH